MRSEVLVSSYINGSRSLEGSRIKYSSESHQLIGSRQDCESEWNLSERKPEEDINVEASYLMELPHTGGFLKYLCQMFTDS